MTPTTIDPIALLDWCEARGRAPEPMISEVDAALRNAGIDDTRRREYATDAATDRIRRRIRAAIPPEVMTVRRHDTPWGAAEPSPNALTEFAWRLPAIVEKAVDDTLADTDSVVAAGDADIARVDAIAEAGRRSRELLDRASGLRGMLDAATAYHRGVRIELGELMRAVKRLRDDHPKLAVQVEQIAAITRKSRSQLFGYRDTRPDPDGPVEQMSLARLAQLHIDGNYGEQEAPYDLEFWARCPTLRGWRQASRHLRAKAQEETGVTAVEYLFSQQARDDARNAYTGPSECPAADALDAEYRETVRALAAQDESVRDGGPKDIPDSSGAVTA